MKGSLTRFFILTIQLKQVNNMESNVVLKVENLTVYQRDIMVLKEVTFEVKSGEFVYLVGKTGSGKSSLLKTLYADLPFKSGFVSIAGYEVQNLKTRKVPYLRRKLGIVFQDFQLLFDRSVSDNLMFVMRATGWKDKSKMKTAIEEVLTKVDLPTKGHKMPHQLSGGEQQRLAIARAIINNPEIILADEPTGNLDPVTSLGIMKLLKNISEQGTAVLMATHDYNSIKEYPGRFLYFNDSKVTEISEITEM